MSATDETEWPFRWVNGAVLVALPAQQQKLLTNLIEDLRQLLMADSHETLRRLKPPAHPDNQEAEKAYRDLVDDDLLRARLDLLDVVESGISGATLDDDAVAGWMQALNMMRLVLGERLELEGVDLDSEDPPDTWTGFLFEYLGQLLGLLVHAASGAEEPY